MDSPSVSTPTETNFILYIEGRACLNFLDCVFQTSTDINNRDKRRVVDFLASHFIQACIHNDSYVTESEPFKSSKLLRELLKCAFRILGSGSDCGTCSVMRVRKCWKCPTNFQLDIRSWGEENKEIMLVMSTWKDFGEGKQPWDPIWQSHARLGEPIIGASSRDVLEDIKAAFEEREYRFEEHLSARMKELLVFKNAWRINGQPLFT